jgi:hypothetical protein
MSDGMVQLVEFLAIARARTDLDCGEGRPIVLVTVRPEPDRSWRPHNLGLTIDAAKRLRDDLVNLLKTPAAFLLLAVLTLASGCSAKVEVTNERPAVAEADSATEPPSAALEKSKTTVEVDFLGQPAGPSVPKLANEQPIAMPTPVPVNMGGIQVNGNENRIEFHYYRCRRSRSPVIVYPIIRHEMVIVPGDGSAPVVFQDNAPPRVALVDEQVARAYAAHMLRLAEQEGRR